jgi:hypothetical protein
MVEYIFQLAEDPKLYGALYAASRRHTKNRGTGVLFAT